MQLFGTEHHRPNNMRGITGEVWMEKMKKDVRKGRGIYTPVHLFLIALFFWFLGIIFAIYMYVYCVFSIT